ncbi:MAG: toll/interleukin-1 receptor domain-containing protein [Saprospiraceae bacterium]|nr:toll/interleukin-1 receptor domain-containing protein [Candidatus Opimibacter iunctus]
MKTQTSIFISHAWGGASDEILSQLTKRLEAEDITFILDKRDLGYRQSIRDFMVQLGEADMVIIILSNKYLKSEYCMFELLEIHKNENLSERIFPIVLDEVKISSSSDRLEFVKYWENQLIDLQNKVKELNSLSYIEGITDDLNLYAEIRNNIARLTGILRDINTLNIKLHQDSDYHDLVEAIKNKIEGNKKDKHRAIPVEKPNSSIITSGNLKRVAIILFALFGLFMAWGIFSKTTLFANKDHARHDETPLKDTSASIQNPISRQDDSNRMVGYPAVHPDTPISQNKPATSTKQQTEKTKSVLKTQNPSPSTTTNIPATKLESKTIPPEPKPTIATPEKEKPSNLTALTRSATLPKGTELLAKSSTTFSSDDGFTLPKRVAFTLDKAVMNGNTIVIPNGSVITAKVTYVRTSNDKRTGVIDLVFEYLQAPDGQKIPLQTNEFHLIAKGEIPMEITAGSIYKLKTSSSLQIKY